jgi:poly-gamma-glutamate synthesis protein (capsule biosynthesis protein)
MKKNKQIIYLIILLTAVLITAVNYFLFYDKVESEIIEKFSEPEKNISLISPYNNKDIYENIFLKLPENPEKILTNAGIVSHHFLAKDLIADFYNKISNKEIKTVFLISPDHYNNFFPSKTLAYTSKASWDTPYEELSTNKEIINYLLKKGSVAEDSLILGLEHGIYIEIPFIKKFFPNATLVPLILNPNATYENFETIGLQLKELAEKDSILVVSSDFSHESTIQNAFEQDSKTIDILKNLNLQNISGANNDCKQCLAVLSGFLGKNKYKFNLIDNQNSFDISGEDKNSVTSYVSGFYTEKSDLQILFTGDLMFDRGIRYYAKKNGSNEFIFDKIYPTLTNTDLVVSNLEGPITNNYSISSGTEPGSSNNYTFTFDKSVAKTLFLNNIRLVNLGNNHILNFYTSGVESTKKYLTEAGVEYFGEPKGNRAIIKELSGIKIAFISYNEFSESTNLDQAQTISEIQRLKSKVDIIIILCHWGTEYVSTPNEMIKDLAHQFINAGADAIIGSHPHVIQSIEEYNGKKIYYSLGNFVFDQYFDEDVRNGLGVILKINTKTKNIDFKKINFYLQSGGQTILK